MKGRHDNRMQPWRFSRIHAFMHHDDKGHDAFIHHVVIKELKDNVSGTPYKGRKRIQGEISVCEWFFNIIKT